jgi:hypothetical protein
VLGSRVIHKSHPTHKEESLVDYYPIRSNNGKPPDPEPEEEQEALQPFLDVVWNVYHARGVAKTVAVKVSIRLPLKS